MSKVRHIGLIPDGGRRWAKRQGVHLTEAYLYSFESISRFATLFYERGGIAISVYLLSKANLSRGLEDLDAVARAESIFLNEMLPFVAQEHDLSIRVAGSLDLLPNELKVAAHRVLRNGVGPRLFLCLAYDPFDEILSAIQGGDAPESTQDLLGRMAVSIPIDLVVRTGGAQTLSNFLPLQAAYARIVFLDNLFNDFSANDLLAIVEAHESLDLKFGT